MVFFWKQSLIQVELTYTRSDPKMWKTIPLNNHRFLTSPCPPAALPLANILKTYWHKGHSLEQSEIIWSHPPPRNTHTITQSDRNCISKHAHKHTSLNHKLPLLQSEEQGVIKTRRVVIRNDWKEGMKEWWNVTEQLESVYDPRKQEVLCSEVNLICVKHFKGLFTQDSIFWLANENMSWMDVFGSYSESFCFFHINEQFIVKILCQDKSHFLHVSQRINVSHTTMDQSDESGGGMSIMYIFISIFTSLQTSGSQLESGAH